MFRSDRLSALSQNSLQQADAQRRFISLAGCAFTTRALDVEQHLADARRECRLNLIVFSSFIFDDQYSPAHACNALIADFGFDATIFNNARAGSVGRLRRCSQF